MAQYNINGHIFIDFKDIKDFFNYNSLTKDMNRARKAYEKDNGTYPKFHNIPSPSDKRKKLIMLSTIPADVQLKVIERLGAGAEKIESAVKLTSENTPAKTTQVAVNAVQKSVEITEPYVAAQLEEYIRLNYAKFLPHYMKLITNINSINKYARTCAFAEWCFIQNEEILKLELNDKAYRRWKRSLRFIIQTLMYDNRLNVFVPSNDKGFTDWFDNVCLSLSGSLSVTDIIKIKRAGNNNSRKITDRVANLIIYYAMQGNALPKTQIHAKVIEVGKIHRFPEWTNKQGDFKPPTLVAISEFIKNNERHIAIAREGNVKHYLKFVHEINRYNLEQTNAIWGIDGTALDANVYVEYANGKSKVYQGLYIVFVFDYASSRLIGISTTKAPTRGDRRKGETKELLIEAVIDAMRFTGYKPSVLQSDHHARLDEFCEQNGIKAIPAQVGNARTKNIESLFGTFGNLVERMLPSWTGQNMTSNGKNSKPSDLYRKLGQKYAPRFNDMADWLKSEARNYWNNHIIEKQAGVLINKTPNQLWKEKSSFTLKMSGFEYAKLTGTVHTVQFTTKGAVIDHEFSEYTYYPDLERAAQRNWLIREQRAMYQKTSSQLTLYITDYGKDSHVFDSSGKYIGLWKIKTKVPMNATIIGETEEYNKQRAIQKEQIQHAKDFVDNAKNAVENMEEFEDIKRIGEETLTGKLDKEGFEADQQKTKNETISEEKRLKNKDIKGSLNKEELNYQEIEHNQELDGNFKDMAADFENEKTSEESLEDKLNKIFGKK